MAARTSFFEFIFLVVDKSYLKKKEEKMARQKALMLQKAKRIERRKNIIDDIIVRVFNILRWLKTIYYLRIIYCKYNIKSYGFSECLEL